MDVGRNDNDKKGESLPQAILDAIDQKRLVVFIGAGVSRLFDLPSWGELAKKMAHFAFKGNDKVHGKISYATEQEIIRYDPKKILSIVYEIFSDNRGDYYDELSRLLTVDNPDNKVGYSLVKKILDWNAHIVTTNYDNVIDNIGGGDKFDIIHSCDDFKPPGEFSPPIVLHFHGSVKKPEKMVITSRQYYDLYYGENHLNEVLQVFFSGAYTVLFIGYGLEESEVQYCLQKNGGRDCFFALVPISGVIKEIKSFLFDYYETINVKMIPYDIDENGYEHVVDIIEAWDKELSDRSLLIPLKNEEIDMILSGNIDSNSLKKLNNLLSNPYQKNHFINSIENNERFKSIMEKMGDSELLNPSCMAGSITKEETWPALLLRKMFEVISPEVNILGDSKSELYDICHNLVGEIVQIGFIDVNTNVSYNFHCACESLLVVTGYIDDDTKGYIFTVVEKFDNNYYYFDNAIKKSNYSHWGQKAQSIIVDYLTEIILSKDNFNRLYHLGGVCDFLLSNTSQSVWGMAFPILSDYMGATKESRSLNYYDLGSINDLLINDDCDSDYVVKIKWMSVLIDNAKKTDLKLFCKQNICSKNHLNSTMALYAINKHYQELKELLYELDNFDNLNYSELYDVINNNVSSFSEDDYRQLIEKIRDSYFNHESEETEKSKLYRYDLLKILDEKIPLHITSSTSDIVDNPIKIKINSLLNDNKIENSTEYPVISMRGKLASYTVSWGDAAPVYQFDNLGDLVTKAVSSDDYVLMRDVNNYLKKHSEEVIDNFDSCLDMDPSYYRTVYQIVNSSDKDEDFILCCYKKCAKRIVMRNRDCLSTMVQSLSSWVSKNGACNNAAIEFIIDLMDSQYQSYVSSEEEISDNPLECSFGNWYVSLYWAIFGTFPAEAIRPYSEKILSLLDKCISYGNINNKLLIKYLLGLKWKWIVHLDEDWSKAHTDAIFVCESDMACATAFLFSVSGDPNVFDSLKKTDAAISLTRESEVVGVFNNRNAPSYVGSYYTFLQYHGDRDCIDLMTTGIKESNEGVFISGVIHQLNYELENGVKEPSESVVLSLLLENIPRDFDATAIQYDLVRYVNVSETNMELKVELIVKYTTNIGSISGELIKLAKKLIPKYMGDMSYVALNLADSPVTYYPEEYVDFVSDLIDGGANKYVMRKVCNIMIRKQYEKYNEFARRIK